MKTWVNSNILIKLFKQGVTFCGTSKASTLTMQNVPWHDEVIQFVKELQGYLPEYEIASEHEHSNCILLASTKVCIITYYLFV